MTTRRELLTMGGVGVLGASAGCLDALPFVGGPMSFESAPAAVPNAALEETGYDEHEIEEVVIERSFEVAGRQQDVVVTNWQSEYDKGIDLSVGPLDVGRTRAAVFTALTTPRVSVLGRTFNPVGDMAAEDLIEMVQDRYDGLDGIEHVGDADATIAGEQTTVGEFEAEADLLDAGVAVDLTIHVAEAVESGDDLILAIGAYPTVVRHEERDAVFTLIEAIEHDA